MVRFHDFLGSIGNSSPSITPLEAIGLAVQKRIHCWSLQWAERDYGYGSLKTSIRVDNLITALQVTCSEAKFSLIRRPTENNQNFMRQACNRFQGLPSIVDIAPSKRAIQVVSIKTHVPITNAWLSPYVSSVGHASRNRRTIKKIESGPHQFQAWLYNWVN